MTTESRPPKDPTVIGYERSARRVLDKAASEDDLLTAITEALTLLGYRWHHVRRSDKALPMGHAGFPDICAARNGVVWFIELKKEGENPTQDQWAWLVSIQPRRTVEDDHLKMRIWRPSDLDAALRELA